MAHEPLMIADIPWLRLASSKAGAADVPLTVARKLLKGGLVERDAARACLTITARGKMALTRLG